MDSFLGVPIRSRNEVFGNLYLTGRTRRGVHAARTRNSSWPWRRRLVIAIENARLYEESQTRQQWLLASAEISGVLLSPDGDRHPLQLIVDAVKRLADADVVTLVVPATEAGMLRVAVAAGEGAGGTSRSPLSARRHPGGVGDGHRAWSASRVARPRPAAPRSSQPGRRRRCGDGGTAVRRGRVRRARSWRVDGKVGRTSPPPIWTWRRCSPTMPPIARELVDARADQQRLAVLGGSCPDRPRSP